MSHIGNERYVRITTFTLDGRPKHTPVWIADLGDGEVGFTTGLDSWKVKRIRNTPRVELTPSDARGKVESAATPVSGTARAVTGPELERVEKAIVRKYGWQMRIVQLFGGIKRLFRRDDVLCAVIVQLGGEPEVTPEATTDATPDA